MRRLFTHSFASLQDGETIATVLRTTVASAANVWFLRIHHFEIQNTAQDSQCVIEKVCMEMFRVSWVCRVHGVFGALSLLMCMTSVTEGFWILNPMFPTVTQLIVADVVGHLADQIHG